MVFRFDIDLFPQEGAVPNAAEVQATVESGLALWWPAFGLPARPEVHIQRQPGPPGLFDFAIRLDGQPCPVPVYQPTQPAPPLAFRILCAIFENRTRLITDDQLRQLRQQHLAETKAAATWNSAPLSVWRAMATLLLKYGFSLNRLNQCFAHWNPGMSPEETFERLVENPEVLTLTLQVNPALAADDAGSGTAWTKRLPEFYPEVYQDWGILLPELVLEPLDILAFEAFRFRFNDLWLPILPGLGAGEALFASPGAEPEVYLPSKGDFYSKNRLPGDPFQLPVVEDPRAYVFDWLKYWVGRLPAWYVNTGIIEALLDNLEESNRSLIVMIREQWPAHRLCGLLRALLADGVSIRNMSEVLDILLRIEGPLAVDDTEYLLYFTPVNRVVTIPPGVLPAEYSTDQLVSQVRASLKFPVVFPHLQNGFLPCYNFDPGLLRELRDGFFQQSVPSTGSAFYQLLTAVRDLTGTMSAKPVLLVPTGCRPAVAAALRPYFPQLTVLGSEEVPPFFIPQVINTIQLPGL